MFALKGRKIRLDGEGGGFPVGKDGGGGRKRKRLEGKDKKEKKLCFN